MIVVCEKSNLALQQSSRFWQNGAKIINVFNDGQSVAAFPREWTRTMTDSSKSLARNEASGMETALEHEPRISGDGARPLLSAGLAVERGFGGERS